jgi:uncharacterized membrane protein
MSELRGAVLGWFDSGRIAPGEAPAVLRAAGLVPSRGDWRDFLSRLTLWLGTVALAASAIFFFAFNWDALGRMAQFGLVEGAILIGLLACWRLGIETLAGKAVLLLLSLLAGALLALAGQVYQTGADPWELFAWWAVLILPWVLLGRFAPLWLLWLTLLNVAVFLHGGIRSDLAVEPIVWSLFGLNGLALAGWEAGRRLEIEWLGEDWPPRLVAIASAASATVLILWAILDWRDQASGALAGTLYLGWLACVYAWYRHVRPDLFMLAAATLSLIVSAATLLAKWVLDESAAGGFLLVGLAVIGMSAAGGLWLKSVAREQPA